MNWCTPSSGKVLSLIFIVLHLVPIAVAGTHPSKGVEPPSDSLPVCIYTGKGIHDGASASLTDQIRESQTVESVFKITDPSMLDRFLQMHEKEKVCYVVPGGNTRETVDHLGAKRDPIYSKMKNAVNRGSNYLGVCCGGNLACSRLIMKMDSTSYEFMSADKLLGLLDAHSNFFSHSITGREGAEGKWVKLRKGLPEKAEEFDVYWNRGSYYSNLAGHIQVVAEYTDSVAKTAPSVLCGRFGKGTVIVSAAHPELDPEAARRLFGTGCPPPSLEDPVVRQKELLEELFVKAGIKGHEE